MATMRDIARLAGVSQGTVSNVLNNRGNVSAVKMKKVQQVAVQLGYHLNAQAQQLRSSSGLSSIVALILPNIVEERYATLFTTLQKFLQEYNYNALLFVTDNSPYLEERAVKEILTMRACAVVSVTANIMDQSIYQPLMELGTKLIFAERKPQDDGFYLGYDSFKAGREIGAELQAKGLTSVGLFFTESTAKPCSDFLEGFQKSFFGKNIAVQYTEHYSALDGAFDLFEHLPSCQAVVCFSEDLCISAMQAYEIRSLKQAPVFYSIVHKKRAAPNREFIPYYENYAELGERIGRVLRALLSGETLQTSKWDLAPEGFLHPRLSLPAFRHTVLNLLMPDNRSTRALRNIAPLFTKKTNIELKFTILPLAELTDTLAQMPYNDFFDICRTNVTTTPSFPVDALMPIDEAYFKRLTNDMLQIPVQQFSYIGDTPFAIPFDVSLYFQIFRKDLFSDSVLQRIFYERTGERLEPPLNYYDSNRICHFFCRAENPESPIPYGTTGMISENTTIVYEFFHRYESLNGRFFDARGESCFDPKLVVSVLETYVEMLKYSLVSADYSRKDTAVNNFCEGLTAVENISTSHASPLSGSAVRGKVGFCELPNSNARIGGGAFAVSKNCRNPKEAFSFIEWACSPEQAYLFTILGGQSPHKSIYRNHEILQLYPWLALVPRSADQPYIKGDLDCMNRYRFEQSVGGTLRSLFRGLLTPEKAAVLIEKNIMACRLDPQRDESEGGFAAANRNTQK